MIVVKLVLLVKNLLCNKFVRSVHCQVQVCCLRNILYCDELIVCQGIYCDHTKSLFQQISQFPKCKIC